MSSASLTSPEDEFGEWLKAERTRKGWTQAELSYEARVEQAKISNYENGHTLPTLPTLWALCNALGVPLPWAKGRYPVNVLAEMLPVYWADGFDRLPVPMVAGW